MTRRQAGQDEDLRELFDAARRTDEAEAPTFAGLTRAPQARPPFRFVLGFRSAAVTLGVAALVVAAAAPFFLMHDAPDPIDVAQAESVEVATGTADLELQPAAEVPQLSASHAERLRSLGYVASADVEPIAELPHAAPPPAPAPAIRLPPSPPKPKPATLQEAARGLSAEASTAASPNRTDKHIADLPVPGRTYTNEITMAPAEVADGAGNAKVHGTRARDFSAVVGGVRNMSEVNPNSIEEMKVITEGGGVEFDKAASGFTRIAANAMTSSPVEIEPFRAQEGEFQTESYRAIEENPFRAVVDHPLSTFSADVDTASYTNVRRFLREGRLPPADAVRIEELINYFRYDYAEPQGKEVFSTDIEVAGCPWNPAHRLARIGIRGRELDRGELAGSNIVFLIDVSGSMTEPVKLPLLKRGLRLLVEQLDDRDRVAMVVYAGNSGLALPSTSGKARGQILGAIDSLEAGGSTNGGAGIALAYGVARENFVPGGVNRVILATDGDFNVGVTSHSELIDLVRDGARNDVFLTVLGFGSGNYDDARLEQLADQGNGNYAYIDSLDEARRVLVEQIGGTLVTIAKDVKLQVEFNPAEVASYRLVGYENRVLAKEDFNDDAKDAGEIGAGHTVTALYELVPSGSADVATSPVDPLRYQTAPRPNEGSASGELFTVKIRYKEPEGDTSILRSFTAIDGGTSHEAASDDFRLASSAALFGMLLRGSEHATGADAGLARALLLDSRTADDRRSDLLILIDTAAQLLARK